MNGVYINNGLGGVVATDNDNSLGLLCKSERFEIMNQKLKPNWTAWLAPAEDKTTIEFFFVHKGKLVLEFGGTEGDVILLPGDSFYVEGLKKDISMKCEEETDLIYAVNRPMFDYVYSFHKSLDTLLQEIDDKDHLTLKHSKNVCALCKELYLLLKDEDKKLSLDDLETAALFHDVGKIFIPDEILTKNGVYTMEEMAKMEEHTIFSSNILSSKYNEKIRFISLCHHENMDGSGYPNHISGEDIPFAPRIISVADSFDAMVCKRSYNKLKTPLEAAMEICGMKNRYDERVANALLKLVKEEKLGLFAFY